MSRATAFCLLVLAAALSAPDHAAAQTPQDTFPHAQHQGLFPLCTGCHVMDGPRAGFYPEPSNCNGCHDGVDERRVSWAPPSERASLLDFSHAEHAREAATDAISCEGCHTPPGAPRMQVERAIVGECLSCHAHRAEEHLVDARCERCHVPLAESRFDVDRIVALPVPPGHTAPDFIMSHSGSTECAICHTRERCETCHVNAAELGDIRSMPPAPADMALPLWTPHYPVPPTHIAHDWFLGHGEAARAPAACSTCHAREDCLSCHVETPPRAVEQLPSRRRVQAPGAGAERSAPPSHAFPDFERAHGADAAVAGASCTACHGRNDCRACHDSQPPPAGFHPVGFATGHAEAAWARRLECSNCHEVEVFCAACHRASGLASRGIQGAIYHDAEPVWLLRHGQAARQGLESCASCHRQQDCLRCHSQLGSFQISPHGPGFDAERARSRNAFVCRACHLADPGRGRLP